MKIKLFAINPKICIKPEIEPNQLESNLQLIQAQTLSDLLHSFNFIVIWIQAKPAVIIIVSIFNLKDKVKQGLMVNCGQGG